MPLAPSDETFNERDSRATEPAVFPYPQLFLAIECVRPLAGSARHALLNIDEVSFGRGPERTAQRLVEAGVRKLVLRVPDRRMSALHARLRRSGAYWTFEDAGSTNGSQVNGKPVANTAVTDGAMIELGHTLFLFRANVATPVGTPGDLDARDLGDASPVFATLLPELAMAFETLVRVARSTVSIILLGETGTGKELLARAIHERSGRKGDFVGVNCGALPGALLESQLFGHAKGAFSGAVRDEVGYVRAADRGTLFLDEIGDLPTASQAALLRVLEEHEVVPIGTTRPVPVDLRIVAATHAPLDELVERGAFRSDLFARLSGFTFTAPPLRDRLPDLGLLLASLLPRASPDRAHCLGLAPEVARALLRHSWPRNIRELKLCLSSAAVLATDDTIRLENLPAAFVTAEPALPPEESAKVRELEEERLRRELLARFAEHRGNVSEVARSMGKARVQVQRWMKRFAIDPASFR